MKPNFGSWSTNGWDSVITSGDSLCSIWTPFENSNSYFWTWTLVETQAFCSLHLLYAQFSHNESIVSWHLVLNLKLVPFVEDYHKTFLDWTFLDEYLKTDRLVFITNAFVLSWWSTLNCMLNHHEKHLVERGQRWHQHNMRSYSRNCSFKLLRNPITWSILRCSLALRVALQV